MTSMQSIVHSTDLGTVVGAIAGLQPEDAARIALPWLQTGIRVVGRDPKATCRFGATLDTYTDMLTRQTTLSALPLAVEADWSGRSQGFLIVLGMAFHEAGHLRMSDLPHQTIKAAYAGSPDLSLAMALCNILEDERLERVLLNDYAGVAPAIDAMRRYMAGSYASKGTQHPQRATYPSQLATKDDIVSVITMAFAYDGVTSHPDNWSNKGVLNVYRYCRKMLKEGIQQEREGKAHIDIHVEQVARLVKMLKRWGADLPDHEQPKGQPAPQPQPGEGKGEDGGQPGGGQGIDYGTEPEPQPERHPFRAPMSLVMGPPAEAGPACTECGRPESDPVHGSEAGDDGDEDPKGEDPKGDGKGNDDGKGSDADDDGDEPGGSDGKPADDGKPGKDGKGSNEGGYQPGPEADPHHPGGRGASAGSQEDTERMLQDLADMANQKLDDVVNDPFVQDKDIMSDGELTGTITRVPENTGYASSPRPIGDADPYLTDTMREAFLATRYSREHYITGFTRGRLRSRDACKVPAGMPNPFSQRQDTSVTRVRLTIMLDYSSSMRGLVGRSDTFFRSLADATQHIAAVRISAWTYDNNDLVYLWESNEGEHVLAERLPMRHPSGGTGTATCLGMLLDEVERTALPGERQVILSITDGQPGDGATNVRRLCEEASSEGIAVVGVNIGVTRESNADHWYRETVEQYGDNAIAWTARSDAWTDLGDEVLTMVGEVLAGARAF